MTQPATPLPRLLATLTVDEFVALMQQHQPQADEVLTTAEAAALLKLHPEYVGQLARLGKLPHWRAGREYRFSRAALLGLLGGGAM